MDADGDLDAATCAYGDKEAWWFENDGKGKFTNHLVARDQEAYDIRAFDINKDGALDLLIAAEVKTSRGMKIRVSRKRNDLLHRPWLPFPRSSPGLLTLPSELVAHCWQLVAGRLFLIAF